MAGRSVPVGQTPCRGTAVGKAEEDMIKNFTRQSIASYIPGFLVGLGIGTLLGVLFAPHSGEDTRDLITRKVRTGLDQVADKAAELSRRVEQAVRREKEEISEAIEAGKQAFYEEQSRPL